LTTSFNQNIWLETNLFFRRKDRFMANSKLKQHHINRDWCKGCGICVELCPKKVLDLDEEDKAVAAAPQDCICCKLCELRCPDLAIEIETED
jgi:2-oxoglutarate ferredoxin oxidoreductase subunit delta